jgi:hypothetical protein
MSWITAEEMFESISTTELKDDDNSPFKVMERGILDINDEYAIAYEILDIDEARDEYRYALSFSFADRQGYGCYLGELFVVCKDMDVIREEIINMKQSYLEQLLSELKGSITIANYKQCIDPHLPRLALRKLLKSWPASAKLYPDLFNKEIIPLAFSLLLKH